MNEYQEGKRQMAREITIQALLWTGYIVGLSAAAVWIIKSGM